MSSTQLTGPGYCEKQDFQEALTATSREMGNQPLQDANVQAAILGASAWFRDRSRAHFYDSGGGTTLISADPKIATGIRADVAESPHRQSGQLYAVNERGRTRKYPVTHAGRYTRVTLPYRYVESIDALRVRQLGGEQDDWVSNSNITQGRGEDYYLQVDRGDSGYGRSYLYLHASTIGPREDYSELLEIDLSYGQDWQDEEWSTVRRGIAALAAAQLVSDDDVISQVPSEGQLIGVDTQVQQLLNQAFGFGDESGSESGMGGYLSPYLTVPVE